MRLIDADALSRAMYHEAFETDSDWQRWDSGLWIRYKMFENALKSAPAIEAEPLRRGRWLPVKGYEGLLWKCSACDSFWTHTTIKTPYCSHCGAKMERRADEDI